MSVHKNRGCRALKQPLLAAMAGIGVAVAVAMIIALCAGDRVLDFAAAVAVKVCGRRHAAVPFSSGVYVSSMMIAASGTGLVTFRAARRYMVARLRYAPRRYKSAGGFSDGLPAHRLVTPLHNGYAPQSFPCQAAQRLRVYGACVAVAVSVAFGAIYCASPLSRWIWVHVPAESGWLASVDICRAIEAGLLATIVSTCSIAAYQWLESRVVEESRRE